MDYSELTTKEKCEIVEKLLDLLSVEEIASCVVSILTYDEIDQLIQYLEE